MKQVEERYISLLTDFGFKRILRQTRIYLCRDFQVQQTPGRTGYALREVALCTEESL